MSVAVHPHASNRRLFFDAADDHDSQTDTADALSSGLSVNDEPCTRVHADSEVGPFLPVVIFELRTVTMSPLSWSISSAPSSPLERGVAPTSNHESHFSTQQRTMQIESGWVLKQGSRESQEDACHHSRLQGSDVYFAGVFDGHRGPEASHYAALYLDECVAAQDTFHTDLTTALVNGIRTIDQRMYMENAANRSGSTALVACVSGRELVVANLGDSRAVLALKDGTFIQLTVDHNDTEESELARLHRYPKQQRQLRVTRSLADYDLKPPDKVASGDCALTNIAAVTTCVIDDTCDFLLMATDGVWNMMSNADSVKFLQERFARDASSSPRGATTNSSSCCNETPRNSIQAALDELLRSQISKWNDNMTAICLRFRQ